MTGTKNGTEMCDFVLLIWRCVGVTLNQNFRLINQTLKMGSEEHLMKPLSQTTWTYHAEIIHGGGNNSPNVVVISQSEDQHCVQEKREDLNR
ncbi:hypothetical protein UPYG_G00217990 [Umbra pygmaea]|uniref:Uncharacterized protein n=1 Tax=Umbra pygmaea TaxID=75934 RepID=A0ABD0WL63_UMBPY